LRVPSLRLEASQTKGADMSFGVFDLYSRGGRKREGEGGHASLWVFILEGKEREKQKRKRTWGVPGEILDLEDRS
jgi:hypothetical protein